MDTPGRMNALVQLLPTTMGWLLFAAPWRSP
jgi:hypothetical protein